MELITEKLILLDENVKDKTTLMNTLVQVLLKENRISDELVFMKDVLEREKIASTAIGDNIAIPHAISTSVKTASLVFLRLNHEIAWNHEDKVKYIFGIAVPFENKDNQHLRILSSLARKMLDDDFKNRILYTSSQEECVTLLKELETAS